jgi:hypothetical protein
LLNRISQRGIVIDSADGIWLCRHGNSTCSNPSADPSIRYL